MHIFINVILNMIKIVFKIVFVFLPPEDNAGRSDENNYIIRLSFRHPGGEFIPLQVRNCTDEWHIVYFCYLYILHIWTVFFYNGNPRRILGILESLQNVLITLPPPWITKSEIITAYPAIVIQILYNDHNALYTDKLNILNGI